MWIYLRIIWNFEIAERINFPWKMFAAGWEPDPSLGLKGTDLTASEAGLQSWFWTHCVTLCHTVSHCVTLCHTVLHCVTLCHTVSHRVTLCYTVSHCVTLCHTVSHCVTPCHTVSHTSGKSDWFLLIDFGLNLDLRTAQWKNMNVRNKFLTF